MRIAFTHNVQVSGSEDEAEYDTPEAVAVISGALAALGHDVEAIDVSGPPSRLIARLEALSPDLIFNTAEGARGRFREAFFPALFERLELPFTGSDAYTCALTLDKQLTKLVLAQRGVQVARGALLQDARDLAGLELRFPVIAKPNYEGSSMGIGADAVAETPAELEERVKRLLPKYPAGVLVEEYVVGRDIVVPFLEKASPATGGVLEPAAYAIDPAYTAARKYPIYDLELKTRASHAVNVVVPADVPPETRAELMRVSRRVFEALQIRDAARIDYRVRPDGSFVFLEINALPSFEPGAAIYESAAIAGLRSVAAVLDSIVRSASARFGIEQKSKRDEPTRAQPALIS